MSWRSILIQNPAKLSLKNKQLLVKQGEDEFTFPIEDLTIVILESSEIAMTSSLLSFLQDNNVVIVSCDNKHMPNGLMLPLYSHSRHTKVVFSQINLSSVLSKRCWQKIIKSKIQNQAKVLEFMGKKTEAELLQAMAKQVKAGDVDNVEARSARFYWANLFENDFIRQGKGSEEFYNSCLNYGYAIVRAFIARSVVAYGLLPCLGVHHNSQLNSYNLVDDLIEPFRAFIDYMVINMKGEILEKEHRQELATIANQDFVINSQILKFSDLVDEFVMRFAKFVKEENIKTLEMPEFRENLL